MCSVMQYVIIISDYAWMDGVWIPCILIQIIKSGLLPRKVLFSEYLSYFLAYPGIEFWLLVYSLWCLYVIDHSRHLIPLLTDVPCHIQEATWLTGNRMITYKMCTNFSLRILVC